MKKNKNQNRLNNVKIPKKKVKKKYCRACKFNMRYIDYKEVNFLTGFLNLQGNILPPRYTGNCDRHQRRIARAIKRSRTMAYLPYLASNLQPTQ
ncbi:MAG: 30S ribosomal protein S18 [Bacteroidota bacterium]